jgi:hypothetical protein
VDEDIKKEQVKFPLPLWERVRERGKITIIFTLPLSLPSREGDRRSRSYSIYRTKNCPIS